MVEVLPSALLQGVVHDRHHVGEAGIGDGRVVSVGAQRRYHDERKPVAERHDIEVHVEQVFARRGVVAHVAEAFVDQCQSGFFDSLLKRAGVFAERIVGAPGP